MTWLRRLVLGAAALVAIVGLAFVVMFAILLISEVAN